jgi:hypothetical protein
MLLGQDFARMTSRPPNRAQGAQAMTMVTSGSVMTVTASRMR